MVSLWRAVKALNWRNAIYKKRRPFATLAEFALPIVVMLLLWYLKVVVEDDDSFRPTVEPAIIRDDADVVKTTTFGDWLVGVQMDRRCYNTFKRPPPVEPVRLFEGLFNSRRNNVTSWISGEEYGSTNPLVSCDSRKCAGDNTSAVPHCEFRSVAVVTSSSAVKSSFRNYLYEIYPVLKPVNGTMQLPFEVLQWYNSEDDMETWIRSSDYESSNKIAVAVVLHDNDLDAQSTYSYKIRVNSTGFPNADKDARPTAVTTPDTLRLLNPQARDDDESCIDSEGGAPSLGFLGNSCTGQYMYNGAITMQRLVDDWIHHTATGKRLVAEYGVSFVPFPTREYTSQGFYASVAQFVPLLLVLAYMYSVSSVIRSIVGEKERRQKALLNIMGVSEFQIEIAWYSSNIIFFGISGIIMGITASLFWVSTPPAVLIIFFFFNHVLFFNGFCCLVASYFSKGTRATLVGLLLFFGGYILLNAVPDLETVSLSSINAVCLHPVALFSIALIVLGDWEEAGFGLNADTITNAYPNGLSFAVLIGLYIRDIILFYIAVWYFNRVVKTEYGRANPLYFPFTKAYWQGKVNQPETSDESVREDDVNALIEAPSPALLQKEEDNECINIKNLTKKFGDKVAVNGLNLTMYKGHITSLLGHNGAGKTTTIGMLTGILPQTSGTFSLGSNESASNIGVCFQQDDPLMDDLTPQEHLQFFAYLKSFNADTMASIERSLRDVALWDKRNTLSKNLSGGMKRKLSVAIAFCADSEVVFLDEPTSGMDPFSRRFTWNVIRKYRQNRCIVLTTHFMDEADLLGDRIAIMAEGSLRCVGSSLFLKKSYGVGYQLTVEKIPKTSNDDLSSQEKEARIMDIVKFDVPESKVLSNVGTELSFQLPLSASSKFPPLLSKLEEASGTLLREFGVGITTLEEVFLLIARGGDDKKLQAEAGDVNEDTQENFAVSNTSTGRLEVAYQPTFKGHVAAQLRKRAANFRRDKKAWFCSTLLPALISFLAFLAVTMTPFKGDMPELVLDVKNLDDEPSERPLMYNAPGTFTCNPGNCINIPYWDLSEETGEQLYFCGIEGDNSTCSITESDSYMNSIFGTNSLPVIPGEASTVKESSQLLYDTQFASKANRYGAVFITRDSLSNYDATSTCQLGSFRSVQDCSNLNGVGFMVAYNYTAVHSSLLYQALADGAILRKEVGSSSEIDEPQIKASIHPLPVTARERSFSAAQDSFLSWFALVLSFPFITATFATFVVSERANKAKHLQTIAGVKPGSYWLSSYLWDVVNYQLPLWIIVILIVALDLESFSTSDRDTFQGVILLLFLFGPAAAAFTYIVSFFFKDPSRCQFFVIVFNFFVGLGGPLASFILRIIDLDRDGDSLLNAAEIMEGVLRFVPSFNMAKGLFFAINASFFELTENDGKPLSVFSEYILGIELIYLAWQSVVYLLVAIFLDRALSNPSLRQKFSACIKCLSCVSLFTFLVGGGRSNAVQTNASKRKEKDSDVVEEETRVLSGEADSDILILKELTKRWNKTTLAVDNLSLGVPLGECFGLLGINGAGKTTTMGMITAEFPPTDGDALLNGFSVSREPEKIRSNIGYCPQFDAHFMNMTGREHVELYARIKGVPADAVSALANATLKQVGLNDFDSDKLSSTYSGGMKRKLSVACAIVGKPMCVFLDEPSTGMDPVARRDMWKVISSMVSKGDVSVILTTHSMEECEALCPRIGIMAGGRLRCLGSAQRLKSRFGQGYQLQLSVKGFDTEDTDYIQVLTTLLKHAGALQADDVDLEEMLKGKELEEKGEQTFVKNFNILKAALDEITGDDSISQLISPDDPSGSIIYSDTISVLGAEVAEVAAFAVMEMRVNTALAFFVETYPDVVVRERQENKLSLEIPNNVDRKLSSIFESIESTKEKLVIADYGLSQTTLEQVFNIHAAEAELEKHNGNSGDDITLRGRQSTFREVGVDNTATNNT